MLKRNQQGILGVTGLALILTVMLLIAVLAFGVWAFSGRQDYKNNVDQKIAVAVAQAKQQEDQSQQQLYNEKLKQPLSTYNGPSDFGSLVLQYPRTWSGYVDNSGQGQALVDGYFYPGVVPSISDTNSTFALRVQVVAQTYSQAVQGLSGQSNATFTAKVYSLPKLSSVVGVMINGTLPNNKAGTMIILPLRDKTLQVWTEGTQYTSDFNNYVLPNLSFSP